VEEKKHFFLFFSQVNVAKLKVIFVIALPCYVCPVHQRNKTQLKDFTYSRHPDLPCAVSLWLPYLTWHWIAANLMAISSLIGCVPLINVFVGEEELALEDQIRLLVDVLLTECFGVVEPGN